MNVLVCFCICIFSTFRVWFWPKSPLYSAWALWANMKNTDVGAAGLTEILGEEQFLVPIWFLVQFSTVSFCIILFDVAKPRLEV